MTDVNLLFCIVSELSRVQDEWEMTIERSAQFPSVVQLGLVSEEATYTFFPFLFFINLFFKFYFIFKLYITVLVLPNIELNPPQVYMCSPS